MPKSDPVEPTDLNLIHFGKSNVHGANSSAIAEYMQASNLLASSKIDAKPLVMHTFSLDDFNDPVKTQADPSTGALKVVIIP